MEPFQAIKDFIEFLVENKEFFKENWYVVTIFGILLLTICIGGFAIFCKIRYSGFSEYKALEADYEELQYKHEELKKENVDLKEQIRNLTIDTRMIEHISSQENTSEKIGEKLYEALKD